MATMVPVLIAKHDNNHDGVLWYMVGVRSE